MKFCELAKIIHNNYERKVNSADFAKILIDAILDDEALENDSPNPLYDLSKSTLEAYCSGRRHISQKVAAQIVPRLSEDKFAEFIETYSEDALVHLRDKLNEYGFEVPLYDVGRALANILAQIIKQRSEGIPDNVIKLDYKRHDSGKLLKNIPPVSIEKKGGKLHIAGEVITIDQSIIPDSISNQELKYIQAMYEAFAEKLHREKFTSDNLNILPKSMKANYQEQRKAYYSAVSIERSVRDTFDDGEDEFQRLKDDAWNGINTTYWREYLDGYERLNAVLEKITNTALDGSVLNSIRNLIGNLEKKGICHILVNDGVINSWVTIDD